MTEEQEFAGCVKAMKKLGKKFEKAEKKTYGDYRPKPGKPGEGFTVVCVVAML